MDERRKVLGKRIYRGRRKAGHRSQRAFAESIGLSESSVANAERGSDSVGASVFTAIEDGLGWPEGSIASYLETGDEDALPSAAVTQKPRPVTLTDEQKLLVRAYWVYRNKLGSHEAAMIQLADDVNTINRVREMIENATKAAGE